MNATVYFLIEDNKTLQFSCRCWGSDVLHQPNVDPGPQSAQRGWTHTDTNSLMSHIYHSENHVYTFWSLHVLDSSPLQRQTHIVEVYFAGGGGKTPLLGLFFILFSLSPLLLYLPKTSSDRLIQIVTKWISFWGTSASIHMEKYGQISILHKHIYLWTVGV